MIILFHQRLIFSKLTLGSFSLCASSSTDSQILATAAAVSAAAAASIAAASTASMLMLLSPSSDFGWSEDAAAAAAVVDVERSRAAVKTNDFVSCKSRKQKMIPSVIDCRTRF